MEFVLSDGVSVELAEMDKSLLAKQEAVASAQTATDRFDAMFRFVSAAMPKEAIEAELGTANAAKVPLPKLGTLYTRLDAAYWREMRDAQIADAMETIEPLREAVNLIASAQGMTRQGFARVK